MHWSRLPGEAVDVSSLEAFKVGWGFEEPGLVGGISAHSREVGTRCSLMSLPTQITQGTHALFLLSLQYGLLSLFRGVGTTCLGSSKVSAQCSVEFVDPPEPRGLRFDTHLTLRLTMAVAPSLHLSLPAPTKTPLSICFF